MTWHTTTTEKPANSVDVLGWTGEKYVVVTYDHWKALPTPPATDESASETPADHNART
jgi:hypothetical protein